MLTRGAAPGGPGSWDWAFDLLSSGLWPRESADQCFLGAGEHSGTGCSVWVRRQGLRRKLPQVIPELSQHTAGRTAHGHCLMQRMSCSIPLEAVDLGSSGQFTQLLSPCKLVVRSHQFLTLRDR